MRDYYKSGKLEVEGLQKNGKPDGWTYVYNKDGSLKREIFFVEGKAYEKDNDKKKEPIKTYRNSKELCKLVKVMFEYKMKEKKSEN